jgi:hypothetical protein
VEFLLQPRICSAQKFDPDVLLEKASNHLNFLADEIKLM